MSRGVKHEMCLTEKELKEELPAFNFEYNKIQKKLKQKLKYCP